MQAVGLGGTGGPAAAVPARAPAEQDDEVAGDGRFTHHVPLRGRRDDGAYLHPLGHIAGVVELVHKARGKADLVAVGAVARCGGGNELALRQLAGQGLGNGDKRVARAGDAHGLVHVGPAGERVAYRPADAGRRAAEGFYLRRVVVSLVLEHQKPGFWLAVHLRRHLHGAGVYLFRLVEIFEPARMLQVSRAQRSELHERKGLVLAAEFPAQREAALICGADALVVRLHTVYDGAEGGVTAVVGPICIQHAQLGEAGVPALRAEIALAELRVVRVHGEAHAGDQRLETRAV